MKPKFVIAVVVSLALVAGIARADWLVTRDGQRISEEIHELGLADEPSYARLGAFRSCSRSRARCRCKAACSPASSRSASS